TQRSFLPPPTMPSASIRRQSFTITSTSRESLCRPSRCRRCLGKIRRGESKGSENRSHRREPRSFFPSRRGGASYSHAFRVAGQAFGAGESLDGIRISGESFLRRFNRVAGFVKRPNGQGREEARGSARGERVVGSGNIIADGFGSVAANEDG